MKHQNNNQEEKFYTERSACQAVEYRKLTLCLKDEIDMLGLEDTMGAGTYGRVRGVVLWPDLNTRQRLPIAREYAYTFSSVWKTFIKDQL